MAECMCKKFNCEMDLWEFEIECEKCGETIFLSDEGAYDYYVVEKEYTDISEKYPMVMELRKNKYRKKENVYYKKCIKNLGGRDVECNVSFDLDFNKKLEGEWTMVCDVFIENEVSRKVYFEKDGEFVLFELINNVWSKYTFEKNN